MDTAYFRAFRQSAYSLLACTGQNLPSMRDVGMQCFKDVIHAVVTADVRSAVLVLVQQEREGETVDHGLLKSVVEVCSAIPRSRLLSTRVTWISS